MAHSRKRSGTLSSLIPPPTPLRDGQSTKLTLWISDQNPDRVILNHESWPGVVKGDVIQVRKKGDDTKSSQNVFYFVVGKDEGGKYGSLQVSGSVPWRWRIRQYLWLANHCPETPSHSFWPPESRRSSSYQGEWRGRD